MSHARFSPSSSDRWIICPGSIAAQEAITTPEDDSSLASRTGTAAHGLLEICIVLSCRPEPFIGLEIEPGCPVIDDKMINGVNIALDWLDDYVEEHGAENLLIIPERKVYIGPMIGLTEEECNGTSDLSIVHKDMSMFTTADYKNGQMRVDPENNSQLMLYTAGGVNELGGKKFKKYTNVIIQPNAAQRRPVNEARFNHSHLVTFLKQAEKAAVVAKMDDAPRNAGPHCHFCKAKNNCQTRRRKSMAAAVDEFGEYQDPNTISDEEMEEVLNEASQLMAYVKAVKDRALKMAMAGTKFAGYELGFGRRTKSFDNEEEVASWLKARKVPQDVYAPRAMLGPAALESALRKAGHIPKAKRGEDKVSPLAQFISLSVPSPALKPKGEKGETDFEVLEDDEI